MADKKITVRLPEKLHARLVQIAANDQRSLNSEIVWILDQWTKKPPR